MGQETSTETGLDVTQIKRNVDVDILLMGMTGVGKSATGNTILGRNLFKSRGGGASITKEFHEGICQIGGRTVRVVDVPGFQDTGSSSVRDQAKIVSRELSRALLRVRNGFDAILLVFPYTRRLTTVEKECVMTFLKLFDKNAFTERGVLILTSGDQFRREVDDMTLQEWIASQNNTDENWLPVLCKSRCVLFDNITTDQTIKNAQVQELLKCIDKFKGQNKYIPEICSLKGVNYDKFVRSKEEVVIYESVLHELAVLDHLVFGDGRAQNIANVKRQAIEVKDLVSLHDIVTGDNTILMTEFNQAADWFNGTRPQLHNSIQSLQFYIEKRIRETEFAIVFEKNFFEKFWEALKNFAAAVVAACNIL